LIDVAHNRWSCGLDKPKRPAGKVPSPVDDASLVATTLVAPDTTAADDNDVVAVDEDGTHTASATATSADTPPLVPVSEYQRSWFQRFSPAFGIRVRYTHPPSCTRFVLLQQC
jgi:hypothetical protein